MLNEGRFIVYCSWEMQSSVPEIGQLFFDVYRITDFRISNLGRQFFTRICEFIGFEVEMFRSST
jgi:hypothetical protein